MYLFQKGRKLLRPKNRQVFIRQTPFWVANGVIYYSLLCQEEIAAAQQREERRDFKSIFVGAIWLQKQSRKLNHLLLKVIKSFFFFKVFPALEERKY